MTPEQRREHWDLRHEQGELADAPPEPALVQAAGSAQPGRALDLACGLGRNSIFLAELGWDVTAVDYSAIALQKLRDRTTAVRTVQADLERGEFPIAPDSFDLIVVCRFLHRPLFAPIRAGIRVGGLFVGVFPLKDDAAAKQMNPAFLMETGELLSYFTGWHVEYWRESRAGDDPARHLRAELVARRP